MYEKLIEVWWRFIAYIVAGFSQCDRNLEAMTGISISCAGMSSYKQILMLNTTMKSVIRLKDEAII